MVPDNEKAPPAAEDAESGGGSRYIPVPVFIASIIPAIVLAAEISFAGLAYFGNGGETLAVNTATVTSCHRDILSGWTQYSCDIKQHETPDHVVPYGVDQLEARHSLHGDVAIEIRQRIGKGGSHYTAVEKGFPHFPGWYQFIGFAVGVVVFFAVAISLTKLLGRVAKRLRRTPS